MSWWKIAWKSIQQRGFASFLTSFSIALGVCLVVLVLTIHGVVSKSFQTNSGAGYHMVVGPKGGKLTLALNTVFYLSAPVGSVPYEYYLVFKDQETRERHMRHSYSFQNQVTTRQCLEIQSYQTNPQEDDFEGSLDQLLWNAAYDHQHKYEFQDQDGGNFSSYVSLAIPIMLGDTYGKDSRFKVVATNEDFFTKLEINPETQEKLTPSDGRIFKSWTKENDVFEAVAGYEVAKAENLKVGDDVSPIHGDLNTGGHEHQQKFKLVGILEPSGTPNDRVLFVNMEGFNLMSDHIKPLVDERIMTKKSGDEPEKLEYKLPEGEAFDDALDAREKELEAKSGSPDSTPTKTENKSSEDQQSQQAPPAETVERSEPLPLEQRELTAILVRSKDEAGVYINGMPPLIDKGQLESELGWSKFRPKLAQKSAQAIRPVEQIYLLLNTFVDPIQQILLFLTVLICVVSGISILVSIYNSMNDRKQEIAIMRALGASRQTIMGVILTETMIISVGGGITGWVAAHLANGVIGPYVQSSTGVSINPLTFAPGIPIFEGLGIQLSSELLLVPAIILFALAVGIIPAISAYKTDVSENL